MLTDKKKKAYILHKICFKELPTVWSSSYNITVKFEGSDRSESTSNCKKFMIVKQTEIPETFKNLRYQKLQHYFK